MMKSTLKLISFMVYRKIMEDFHMKRAEKLLRMLVPGLSRKFAIEAIKAGLVTHINGKTLKKGSYINSTNELDTTKLREHLENLEKGNPNLKLEIIEKEDNWLIVDKPPGIPSNPNSLFDFNTVTHWALYHYPSILQEFNEIQPTITPHRLDIGTSGLQVTSLTQSSFTFWRKLFSSGILLEKTYLMWCLGIPKEESFIMKNMLAHHPTNSSKMIVVSQGEKYRGTPRMVELKIEILKVIPEKKTFLAKAITKTGVTHQIRVCMAFIGFPLVGDPIYGGNYNEKPTPYHLLRAKSIRGKNFYYEVSTKSFERLFT